MRGAQFSGHAHSPFLGKKEEKEEEAAVADLNTISTPQVSQEIHHSEICMFPMKDSTGLRMPPALSNPKG